MRIGLSFDLKEKITSTGEKFPDDEFEEYDYPLTVDFIASALAVKKHTTVMLGGGIEFLKKITQEQVDIVFNISEGRGTYRSREAQVPSVLEMLNIPYTGSDPECLSICLDKPLTKQLVSLAGLPTPQWKVIKNTGEMGILRSSGITCPVIIKPAFEGSSKGVRLNSVADDIEQANKVIKDVLELYRQPVIVEQFISGEEVTVGIIGNSPGRVVGIMRILPRKKTEKFVYSVEVKRDWKNQVEYECPPELPVDVLDAIKSSSIKIYELLECRDFARLDFRIDSRGTPYFIEVNPLPGLGDYSDLIIMAIKMGWTHESVIQAVMNAAIERYLL